MGDDAPGHLNASSTASRDDERLGDDDHDDDRDDHRDNDGDWNRDYDRDLGVIEAITWVTRSCPNGRVVAMAEGALEAIKAGGAAVMKQQAWLVLSALQGWRGDRAVQVHRSLTRYLEEDHSS